MQKIVSFLQKYYKKDEKVILACSAGPDSMFLLYKILETQYKKNLVICYFNHKTRPGTDLEEKFLVELGKKEDFTVEVAECNFEKIKKLYPSKSFEELAREKRYQFFDAIMHLYKTDKILTAHHLDDKIETFFFNLNRGSKLSGLINMTECSIPYSNRKGEGIGILRPLLNIEKSNILEYLDSNNLKYFIDETNLSSEYSRNYLRNEIIPKFEKINKNYKKNIANTLNYFSDLKDFIDEEVKKFLYNSSFSLKGSTGGTKGMDSKKLFFSISSFNSLSSFLQKEIIRYIYYISNGRSTIGLSEANIAEVIRFINGKNNKTIKEIQKLKMEKDGDKIFY